MPLKHRYFGQLKITIVVRVIVAVRLVHSTWKSWISIETKWFTWIVRWPVQVAVSHVVCNRWRFQHHLAKLSVVLNKNGRFAIHHLPSKITVIIACSMFVALRWIAMKLIVYLNWIRWRNSSTYRGSNLYIFNMRWRWIQSKYCHMFCVNENADKIYTKWKLLMTYFNYFPDCHNKRWWSWQNIETMVGFCTWNVHRRRFLRY